MEKNDLKYFMEKTFRLSFGSKFFKNIRKSLEIEYFYVE